MRKILLLIIALFTFAGQLQAVQIEQMPIDSIEVIGGEDTSTELDPSGVVNRIKTRAGDVFSQTIFDQDLKTLAKEFDRVDPSVEVVNKKLKITLKVWAKPMIRSITWDGNCRIETSSLQSELGVSVCSVFDRQGFNKAFHKLKAYYIKNGYFEAELSYTTAVDPCTNEIDIAIQINEGRSGRISGIVYHGFNQCEVDEISELLVTKEYNLLSFFTGEGNYNEDMVQHDRSQIINFLQNEGYADVTVDVVIVESAYHKNRIEIHLTACKGACYTLGAVTFEGNTIFCNEEIERCLLIQEGGTFSPEMIRETASRIERLYGRRGYIDANVSYEPKLELDCGSVYSVNYVIEEGEPFRIGMVKVFGNCTTQTNVILHETLLVPGEKFNTDKLKRTEERLTNIGYFSNVNVYAVRSEGDNTCEDGSYRDVNIEVEEKQTGKFGVFFGYSTVETLFGGLSITEKNFNSAGLCSILSGCPGSLRGGGEFLSLTSTVGNKSTAYGLSWTKPYFMDTKWSVGFDIDKSYNRYISDDYDIKALGYTLRANYEFNPFVRLSLHYRIRNTKVSLDSKPFEDCELYHASRIHGLISAAGFAISYDSTDRFEMPTRGFRSVLEAELAGIGGDHTFYGLAYLNSYYTPFLEKGVFKLRGDFRFLQPFAGTGFNDMPLDERLFLGGTNTVRGYKDYKIGPQFPISKDPKGGISMQILSAQYNYYLNKRVIGFLFADAGHLSTKDWDFGRLYTSVGFGAQVKLLDSFPPITLGLGFPINPKHHGEVKNFFINFGASF
ncbi:MAG: outer membrane protein assembly factor BamA [Parachlamydiaceae bacterium]